MNKYRYYWGFYKVVNSMFLLFPYMSKTKAQERLADVNVREKIQIFKNFLKIL